MGGSSSPRTSMQRHYITLESRIRGAGSPAEPPPRLWASDYLQAPVRYTECRAEVALGPVPPAAGAGSMFAAHRGPWMRPDPLLPSPSPPTQTSLVLWETSYVREKALCQRCPRRPRSRRQTGRGALDRNGGRGGAGGRTHMTEISR